MCNCKTDGHRAIAVFSKTGPLHVFQRVHTAENVSIAKQQSRNYHQIERHGILYLRIPSYEGHNLVDMHS